MLSYQPPDYDKWPADRRTAWDALPTAADAYHVKYLPPGEKPAEKGNWTAKEVSNFEKLLKEHPEKVSNGSWGLLAMHHPGRTGAQCRERYEHILAVASGRAPPQPTPITERNAGDPAPPVGTAAASLHSPIPSLHYSPAVDGATGAAASSAPLRPSRLGPNNSSSGPNAGANAGAKRKAAAVSHEAIFSDGRPRNPAFMDPRPLPSLPAAEPLRSKYARFSIRLSGAPLLRTRGGRLQPPGKPPGKPGRPAGVPPSQSATGARPSTAPKTLAADGVRRQPPAVGAERDREADAAAAAAAAAAAQMKDPKHRAAAAHTPAHTPVHAPPRLAPSMPSSALAPVRTARPGQRIPTPALPPPFYNPEARLRDLNTISDADSAEDDSDSDDSADSGGRWTPHRRGASPPAQSLTCVGPDGRVRSHDAISAAGAALHHIRSWRARLKALLDRALNRELAPHLGGTSGIFYPTFSSLDALAAAVNAAPRLAEVAVHAQHEALAVARARCGDLYRTRGGATELRATELAPDSSVAAQAAFAGAAAAAEAAGRLGATVPDATVSQVAKLLATHEAARADVYRHEMLQVESLDALQRWEAVGRPGGPSGALPVFPLYTYTRSMPPLLMHYDQLPPDAHDQVSTAIAQARAAAEGARGSMHEDLEAGDDDLEAGDDDLEAGDDDLEEADEALGSEEDGDAGTEGREPADSYKE